ncbi:MAG: endolytic transglycosylase MltG [Pseudomonadota bacterium]
MKKYFFYACLLFFIIIGLTAFRFYYFCITPFRSTPPVTALVTIPEGSSLKKIAGILETQGLIGEQLWFALLAKLKKAEHTIKSGDYSINLPLSPVDILEKLLRGEVILISMTVPEGSTIFDIARIIENAGFASAESIVQKATDPLFVKPFGFDNESLEGFLFPDTYRFRKKTDPEIILSRMATRFKDVFDNEINSIQAERTLSAREIIILASLVEKETPQPDEKPVIAGVFFNRLKNGMRLECDPTVVYGVKLEDPLFQGRLRRKHLQKATPYNTYQIHGLPYGPICNPGLESIRAVLKPAAVDYLFFVSKNNKTHQFSRTLEEHNSAVRQYQR